MFTWDMIPGSAGGRVGTGDSKGNEPIKAIMAPQWATWSLWSLAYFPLRWDETGKTYPLSTHPFVKGYCWGHTSPVLLLGIPLRSRVLPCPKDAPRPRTAGTPCQQPPWCGPDCRGDTCQRAPAGPCGLI